MKPKHIIFAISLAGFLLVLTGCIGTASFGSKAELYDANVLQKLRYIHVMPMSIEMERGKRTDIPDSLVLTRMLAKELASRPMFSIVASDTIPLRSADTTGEEMKQVLSSGVVIFARMIYIRAGFGEPNARLSLKLTDPSTARVMAYSSHDTFTGNSYFFKPSYEDVTGDAIKGAVDALEKSMTKSK